MARKILYGLIIGLASGLVSLLAWKYGALERLEAKSWDYRVQELSRPSPFTGRIRIIFIDQPSLDWVNSAMAHVWPWPRTLYQPILDYCRRQGAKAVAFDMLFTESSSYGVDDDQAFAAAITAAPPFAAAVFLGQETGGVTNWPADIPFAGIRAAGLDEWLGSIRRKRGVSFPRASFPVSELAAGASVLGNVSARPDPDAIFRRVKPFAVFDGRAVPSLATAAFMAGETNCPVVFSKNGVSIGGKKIALDSSGSAILNFRGRSGTHTRISAASVIQTELKLQAGEAPPAAAELPSLKDCYVFLGCNAPGLLDLRPSPVGRVYTGVELHATALDNLLMRDFIRDLPKGWTVFMVIGLGIFWGLAAVLGRGARDILIALVLALPLPAAACVFAYARGLWMPFVAPETSTILAIVSAVIFNYATEGRQKRFIRGAFRQYLSEEVIDQLVKNPEKLALGGEQKTLSIFFSDLQGFTGISEGLSPQQLTSLLNDYLTAMTDIIQEEGGTVDKYEGDAIIAFWNAPLEQSDHAARAVRAALRCQDSLAAMRPQLRERTGKDLFMRIGLNTGPVVVGNMGSHKRFNYTILGDAANLASRLEGVNKQFGTYTLESETTFSSAGPEFPARELGLVSVVGRKAPVRIYEPIAPKRLESMRPVLEAFAAGLKEFYAGRFDRAAEIFGRIAAEDAAASSYAAKCRQLASAGPQPNWKGVWIVTEK